MLIIAIYRDGGITHSTNISNTSKLVSLAVLQVVAFHKLKQSQL